MRTFIFTLLLFITYSFTYEKEGDLIIKTNVDSCELYRNIKITFINCGVSTSKEFIASCKCTSDSIVVPDIMKFKNFKDAYEASSQFKIKLLKASGCTEQIIKIKN